MYSGLDTQLSYNAPTTQDNSCFNVLGEGSSNAYIMENIPISIEYLWSSGINTSINTLDSSFNQQTSSNQFLQNEMSHFFPNQSEMMLYQPYFGYMNDIPLSQYGQNHAPNSHGLVQSPCNIDFFSGHDYHHVTQPEAQHMTEAAVYYPLSEYGQNQPPNAHDLVQTPWNNEFMISGHDYQHITQPEVPAVCSIPLNLLPPTTALTTAAAPIGFQRSIVYPSVMVPPKDPYSSILVSRSLDLQAVDPFSPPCDGGSSSQTPHTTDLRKQSGSTLIMGHDGMRELQDPLNSNCRNKENQFTKARRYRKYLRAKKLCKDLRDSDLSGSSCSPQKGKGKKKEKEKEEEKKKEKGKLKKNTIRDRVEALRELVAPYGKKDAEFVLDEAIKHIRDIYEQLKSLSKFHKQLQILLKGFYLVSICGGSMSSSTTTGDEGSSSEYLRQRGLCLVSHSYASYLNSYLCGYEANNQG